MTKKFKELLPLKTKIPKELFSFEHWVSVETYNVYSIQP